MNYFLVLIIIGMGFGGYYEYGLMQQQQSDLDAKIVDLEAKNKQLEDDKAKLLAKGAGAPEPTIVPNSSGGSLVTPGEFGPGGGAPLPGSAGPAPAPKATGPGNALGDIATTDGKTYQNCKLLKVDTDGIIISHADGILKLSYIILPGTLKSRFGASGAMITPEQAQALDQQRQAAGN